MSKTLLENRIKSQASNRSYKKPTFKESPKIENGLSGPICGVVDSTEAKLRDLYTELDNNINKRE